MKEVLNIYKPLGMTTVQALEEFRRNNPEYEGIPVAYTGRLDPMAEGVLIFLAGEKRREAEDFQKMEKEYVADILFGFSSDSYDLLGISEKGKRKKVSEEELKSSLDNFKGKVKLPLPAFCSYRIKGKPMFHWAQKGELNEKDIPVREMNVFGAALEELYSVSREDIRRYIEETIGKVKGNFRQEIILENWKKILDSSFEDEFPVARIRFEVSGGTYIRSIADRLGKDFGGALLYRLKRTRVGKFTPESSILVY